MGGRTRWWLFGTGGVVILAVAVFAIVRMSTPDLVPVAPVNTGGVTIAGQLTMTQTGPAVSAHLTISADRAATLRQLVVRVRDEAGGAHDFPALANVAVSTTPRELVFNGELTTPGTYTYYLAYQLTGDWVSLPPWQTIAIR
ncbi:FixH family protein [Kutzneria sp. CA-103260]|uniref:FixH family protein n=1 Tax=Kutzneria sp. CA-103260 TaxID=2802641 RepID=UPI001BA89807|nr:FixH family protein [Kutzneria sp. CA-103260]